MALPGFCRTPTAEVPDMDESTCSIDGCDRLVAARGWCAKHYKRWKTHGDPLTSKYQRYVEGDTCRHPDGCDRRPKAYGWCHMHWQRIKSGGEPGEWAKRERQARFGGDGEPLPCNVEGCERGVQARGLCGTHYTQWRARTHPDAVKATKRRAALRGNYGITPEQYEHMREVQNGCCAICAKPVAGRLHTDHNHVTGAVRQLLCRNCNLGVGHFKEDPVLLRAAAEYLERHAK